MTSLSSHAGVLTESTNPVCHRVLTRPWKKVTSYAWRRPEHINILECRATLNAVRWSMSLPRFSRSRFLLFCDSTVVVAALSKGRSSSHSLLIRVRCISSLLLGSGTQLYCHWVRSAQNPADEAS